MFLNPAPTQGFVFLPRIKISDTPHSYQEISQLPSPKNILKLDYNEETLPKSLSYIPDFGNRFIFPVDVLSRLLKETSIKSEVKKGGRGSVVFGYDEWTDREVALKLLSHNRFEKEAGYRSKVAEFFNEARILANLQHPHIVKINDLTLIPSVKENLLIPGIIMEKIDGENLQTINEKTCTTISDKKLTPFEIAEIFIQIGGAIDFLHSNGILNNDIKPSNIMLRKRSQNDEQLNAVLIDGDIMTRMSTASSSMKDLPDIPEYNLTGTIAFAAPERIKAVNQNEWYRRNAMKPAADEYSFATSAYHTLAYFIGLGEYYVDKLRYSSLYPPIKGLSDEVNEVLKKGLSRVPENRYTNCSDFAKELSRALLL